MSLSVELPDVGALQRDLEPLLRGQGDRGQAVLDRLNKFKNVKEHINSLGCTARELQSKVISLQQEKTTLEEMLLSTQQGLPPSPNRNESMEVLALKDQLIFHEKSEAEYTEKNIKLETMVEVSESQNMQLMKRIEELEENVLKYQQTAHCKPMNRTDSEKEKLKGVNTIALGSSNKRDKNSQTYTKMLDKGILVKYEEPPRYTNEEFDFLDQQMQNLYEENMSLKRKLEENKLIEEQSDHRPNMSDDGRLMELEEYCEDLQDRLQNAEMSERQLREKLKLAEHTINDLESSEGYYREKMEDLIGRDNDTKREMSKLFRTVQELKEIVLDKDVIETSLHEKVDFLEKAELASAQIIQELQNNEKSLRRQLEMRSESMDRSSKSSSSSSSNDRLKNRIGVLERENKKLSVHVSELEEDEEVLRENWKRVADEDANRIESLEEKVKMVESINKQLKNSLQDAQDSVYIHNNVPLSSSLASEINESEQSNGQLSLSKRSFSTPYLRDAGYEMTMPPRSLSHRDLDMLTEAEGMEKIQELQEQLENVVEDKNSKIENLHEKIAKLRENEVKLTETLFEMESEERELKAKLALYESSQVTVERMLHYENKIMELHSSQENLLDKLESLEDHDLTLQEKLDKAEQQAKIKVQTAEKQLKHIHSQLDQAKLRGEELMKEKELLMKQIDKLENKIRLYVRKGEEAKEKITELNGKISVYEQREAFASEKVREMEASMNAIQQREEHSRVKVAELEKEVEHLRKREVKARARLEEMKGTLRDFEERDSESSSRISELEKHEEELMEKVSVYAKTVSVSKEKISELEHEIGVYNSKLQVLEKDLTESRENEKSSLATIDNMEKSQCHLRESLKTMKTAEVSYVQQLSTIETTKSQRISELEKENHELADSLQKLERKVREHVGSVKYLEKRLSDSQGYERTSAEKVTDLELKLGEYEELVGSRASEVKALERKKEELTERLEELNALADELESENRSLKDQVWNLQQEKRSIESLLSDQVGREGSQQKTLDSLENSLSHLQQGNQQYENQILKLSQDVESHENQTKDLQAELDKMLTSKTQLEQHVQNMSEEVKSFEKENTDLRKQISDIALEKEEIQSSVDTMTCDVDFLNGAIADLKFTVRALEKDKSDLRHECETVQTECYDLKQKIFSSRSFDEDSHKKSKLMSHEIESLEHAKKELLKSVLSLENEKHKLGSELANIKSECDSVKVKLNESYENEKNLRERLTMSEEEVKTMQGCLKALEAEVVSLKESREVVEKENSEMQHGALKLQSNQSKAEELEKDKSVLVQELQDLQQDYDKVNMKLDILQDTETKLMERVNELEEVEQTLQDELEKAVSESQISNERLRHFSAETGTSETSAVTEMSMQTEMSDQSTSTSDLMPAVPPSGRKVSVVFQRVQELEIDNKELTMKLQDYENAMTRVRQMKEKVKLLEQSEDKLMERVMELEESEDKLRNNASKFMRTTSVECDGALSQDSKGSDSDTLASRLAVEQLEKENVCIQNLLESEREKVEKIVNEKMILQEELQHLTENIDEDKQQLQEKVKVLERMKVKEQFKVDSLQSSEIVLKKNLEACNLHKKKMEQDISELQSQTIDFQSQIVDLENELQEERHKVEIVNDRKIKSEDKIASLEKRLSERKMSRSDSADGRLLGSVSGEKNRMREVEKELRKTQEKMEEIQTEYEQRLSDIHCEKQTLEQSEKQLKSAINGHIKKEQELQTEISKICDKSKQLEDRVSDLQAENSSLVEKCDSLTEHVNSLKDSSETRRKSSLHQPILPKITSSFATSSSRSSKDILKKPLPFGASKPMQSPKDKDLQIQVTTLLSNQKELLETISGLEKENAKLRGTSSSSSPSTVTSSLFMSPGKRSGVSRLSGASETSSKEELQHQVLKLEEEQQQELHKVQDLEKQLAAFRAEVRSLRDFLVSGEKKTDIYHSRVKATSASAHQVPEMASLEMELRRKIAEIQHREQTLRSDVSPISLEKLKYQVIELEASEARLKKKVVDLQLSEDDLKNRIRDNEKSVLSRPVSLASHCDGNHGEFLFKIDNLKKNEDILKSQIARLEHNAQNSDLSRKVEQLEQSEKVLKKKVERLECQQVAPQTPEVMWDKPEDVLMQQIKDLEKLDKHHRDQILELEVDRDELHEIARRDKATIHDQNVRVRELQLSEKVLREQVERLEASDTELYQKCEHLESQVSKMEDEIHLLRVHERRLRELVKKLKLDEELWIAKSENMEMTVEELAASEVNLRKRLEELATEKLTLAQKEEYLRLRCQELESSETLLYEKVKNFENVEVSLQNKLMVLENSEAAATSKISELDMMNMDISTRLQRAVEENSVLYNHIQGIQGNLQELNRQLLSAKDSEMSLKQEVQSSQKNESVLQKRLKEFELRDIDSQAKVRQLEQTEAIMKDRISNLQRSENKLKYRIQEMEGCAKQIPVDAKEKLPSSLEECQKKILFLQTQVHQTTASPEVDKPGVVRVPKSQFDNMKTKVVLLEEAERQMVEMEKLNAHLQDINSQLTQGKGVCGHEVELDICRRRISSYENTVQRLKQILPAEQVPSLLNSDSDVSGQGSSTENLPRDLHNRKSERVMQTMRGLTQGSKGSAVPRPLTQNAEDLQPSDLSSVEEEPMQQVHGSRIYTRPRKSASNDQVDSSDAEVVVEEQWKRIESKKPRLEEKKPASWTIVGKAVPSTSPQPSTGSQEELMIGLTLHSESEHSHCRSQNDTDSNRSSPNLHHQATASQSAAGFESPAPPLPKSLPPSLQRNVGSFAGESYYPASSDPDASPEESRTPAPRRVPHPQSEPAEEHVTRAEDHVTRTASVDSVADSGQGTTGTASWISTSRGSVIRNRIAQLEKQLQSKSSGAESRTDEEDSMFTWKHKMLEHPKKIDIIEKENKNAKEEINKLEKELEEKRRHIETFETWMNCSEELLRNKEKHNDRDIIQNLQSQLVIVRSELQNSHYRREDLLSDPAALKTEVDKLEREIAAKNSEIASLLTEVQRWQEESRQTEIMRSNALDSLQCLEVEVTQLQDADDQLRDLKQEYNALREQLEQVSQVYKDYKIVLSEKEDMEAEIESLRIRLRSLGVKEAENSALEGQLEGSARILSDRMERVEQLKQELVRLQDKMADVEMENNQLKTMQSDYLAIKSRYEDMERLKNKAIMSVSPLKAQVARLCRKCRDKDALILRLCEVLKNSECSGSLASLLEELDQIEMEMENEEYNRSMSPFSQSNRDGSPRSPKIDVNSFIRNRRPSSRRSSSSSISGELFSDSETGNHTDTRPKSADQILGRRSPFQGSSRHKVKANNLSPRGTDAIASMREKYGNLPDARHFVAVTDYIPEVLTTSGRASLELRLQEGDKVNVTGPINENGYYEAECNGRVGMVPATCLQPASLGLNRLHGTPKERRLKQLKSPPCYLDSSPEKVTEMYHNLQSPSISPNLQSPSTSPRHVGISRNLHSSHHSTPKHLASSSTPQTGLNKPAFKSSPRTGPPDSPRRFHVERLVGESGIMLSWLPPELDELGNSNNSHVVGYRIYVNGRVNQQPSSPHLAKCVVEYIEQNHRHQFSILTVSDNGLTSPLVDTLYRPTELPHWDVHSDSHSSPDLSSILSSRNYDQEERRLFLGLYDYEPSHHSPHVYTGYELAFLAGDVISVFGDLRPDGFYHGEIEGKRGLVPSSFIEEVPMTTPKQKHVTADSPTPTSLHSSKRRGPASHRLSPRS